MRGIVTEDRSSDRTLGFPPASLRRKLGSPSPGHTWRSHRDLSRPLHWLVAAGAVGIWLGLAVTASARAGSGRANHRSLSGPATFTIAASPHRGKKSVDDFNRASVGLGAGWSAISDGGLRIVAHHVTGMAGPRYAGDIRRAAGERYASNQYSQIAVIRRSIGVGSDGAGEWIGPVVRSHKRGQDAYVGIYLWNRGHPQLRLYERSDGSFEQLGNSYDCGILRAGTKLRLTAAGSTISFAENGADRIVVDNTTLTGGAPGIMAYGAATAVNWSMGDAAAPKSPQPMQVQRVATGASGVVSYKVTSSDDGYGPHILRVLAPTHPARGVPHNFLYVLPVEPELGTTYGDGLKTLRRLDAQNRYNLTIVEPSFAIDPWYANNPKVPQLQYETFMTKDLVPWVTRHLAVTGHEQNWLIGFSKSGLGAQDLLLKHPDLFAAAASWDFPAGMATYDQFGSSSTDEYGTNANFQANYRLTASFVHAHKAPFVSENRIWIGGYDAFQTDVADYDTLLSSQAIKHTSETPQLMAHRWDSGWVPIALSALRQEGAALPAAP